MKLNDLFLGLFLFTLSTGLVYAFCHYALKRGLLDIPNSRSSHHRPVPRGGGIIFAVLWMGCVWIGLRKSGFLTEECRIFLPGTFLIALLGFWDDWKGIAANKRFIAQVLVASLTVLQLGGLLGLHLWDTAILQIGWLGSILAIFGIVWSVNTFNFMDGLDGIAAIEALFVFGVGGFLLWNAGALALAWLAWAIVFLVAGFLIWNWPKARVFMGDVGSYFLGFLVALFALMGDKYYHLPISVWIILYGAFWFDATLTLLRRFWQRENLAAAHREHAYQRCYRAGFSAKQVLAGMIGLNSVLASMAILASFKISFLKWALLLSVLLLALVYGMIETLKPMANKR